MSGHVEPEPDTERLPELQAAWRLCATSVIGTSHLRHGAPCQDAHHVRVRDDGTLLVAVADGAGSAARSKEGAEMAAHQVLASLDGLLTLGEQDTANGEPATESMLADPTAQTTPGASAVTATDDQVVRQPAQPTATPPVEDSQHPYADHVRVAMGTARACVEALAEAAGEPLGAFACTLSCAILNAQCVTTAQIGDGLMVVRDAEAALTVVGEPQRGEYANETPMLTSKGALDDIVVHALDAPATGVALMSDGLLRLAADTSTMRPHKPFFDPLFSWLDNARDPVDCAALEAFLASDRVTSRTDDDKTLVLAVRIA